MDNKTIKIVIAVGGMTCTSCEARIERGLKQLDGILEAKADFASSKVFVTFDENKVSQNDIYDSIKKSGYEVKADSGANAKKSKSHAAAVDGKFTVNQAVGIAIIIVALYVIIQNTVGFNFIPKINQSMSYGILFVVGLLTSLHCIAMCGGINLSQCISYKHFDNTKTGSMVPSFLYNLGRVISYTIIGGIAGAIGSAVSFSGMAKGLVAIAAGIFMVIMGLNMLNIFPWLRRLNIHMPRIFGEKLYKNSGKYGPFYVGLLNGLMPCGPLQSMQLYALGTGNAAVGALSMFVFSLGTVPLMFGFGAVSSALGKRFTNKLLKISAVLVIVLGFVMLGRGFALSGIVMDTKAITASKQASGNVATIENGVQTVKIDLESGRYKPIVVQKGIPVKFIINADKADLNGCNRTVVISKYGVQKDLEPGENLIEFTPDQEGTIPYSCWMGMIKSSITVVADLSNVDASAVKKQSSTGATGSSSGVGGAGCCGASGQGGVKTQGAAAVGVAKIKDGVQEITVKVDGSGFTPSIIVLQKGVKAKIKMEPVQVSGCNNVIVFPEYEGQLDLSKGQYETPALDVTGDFTFSCWMGMLNGYVKVVDDINKVNIDEIKKSVASQSSTPAQGAAGSGGCCSR